VVGLAKEVQGADLVDEKEVSRLFHDFNWVGRDDQQPGKDYAEAAAAATPPRHSAKEENVVEKKLAERKGNKEKAFKELVNTIKKKVDELGPKLGVKTEFAVMIEDTVHDPKAKPPSKMAGKVITFSSGSLTERFHREGIKYNMEEFYELGNKENFSPSELQKEVDTEIKEKDEQVKIEKESLKKENMEAKSEATLQKKKKVLVVQESKPKDRVQREFNSFSEQSEYLKLHQKNIPERESVYKSLKVSSLSSLKRPIRHGTDSDSE
jgi:hypothetical protein